MGHPIWQMASSRCLVAGEMFEVLTWAQLGLHRKPCGLLNVAGYYDGLLSFLEHSVPEAFVRRELHSMLVSTSAGALLQQFENYQPPAEK